MVLSEASDSLHPHLESMGKVATAIQKHPYWKYNNVWSREVQQTVRLPKFPPESDSIFINDDNLTVASHSALPSFSSRGSLKESSKVLKLSAPLSMVCRCTRLFVESIALLILWPVPVNLKDEDAFHVTIEEYLHAVVSLTEELARLAVNAVTLGDFQRPIQISKFVKVRKMRSSPVSDSRIFGRVVF